MKYQLLVIVIFIFFVNGAHSQLIPEKAAVDTSYSISTEEFEEMKNNGIVLPPIKPADDRWANLHYKSSRELPLMYDMRQNSMADFGKNTIGGRMLGILGDGNR